MGSVRYINFLYHFLGVSASKYMCSRVNVFESYLKRVRGAGSFKTSGGGG